MSSLSALGKTSAEKSRKLSGIARISEPPTPQFGQLGTIFSGRQNGVLRVWQEKSTNDDNDNCNDNCDSNDDNFDDNDEKMTKKHTDIMTFQQKCTNLRDFYLVKKGPKNLGIGKPPPLSGNARK